MLKFNHVLTSFPGLSKLQFFDRLQNATMEGEGVSFMGGGDLMDCGLALLLILVKKPQAFSLCFCKQSKTGAGEGLGTRIPENG